VPWDGDQIDHLDEWRLKTSLERSFTLRDDRNHIVRVEGISCAMERPRVGLLLEMECESRELTDRRRRRGACGGGGRGGGPRGGGGRDVAASGGVGDVHAARGAAVARVEAAGDFGVPADSGEAEALKRLKTLPHRPGRIRRQAGVDEHASRNGPVRLNKGRSARTLGFLLHTKKAKKLACEMSGKVDRTSDATRRIARTMRPAGSSTHFPRVDLNLKK